MARTMREVLYGTRLMQARIDTSCVGGARATSAARSAVLFSRNSIADVFVVIERQVGALRTSGDRDDYDPDLLPGDATACYDSGVTNTTEVGSVLGVLGAATLVP